MEVSIGITNLASHGATCIFRKESTFLNWRGPKAGSRVDDCVALSTQDGIRLLIVIPDVPFSTQYVADNNKITRRDLALDVCATIMEFQVLPLETCVSSLL